MRGKRILIIDDEEPIRAVLAELFEESGAFVGLASTGREGFNKALDGEYDLLLLDHSLPDADGLSLLGRLKESKPDHPVIMITGYASIRSAIEAMRLGAYDYITKPFDLDHVQLVAKRALDRKRLVDENRYLKEELRKRYGFDNVVGRNPVAQRAYLMAAKVANSNASVLILGETGTGKEYLARAIHYHSPRADKPFVKLSCAALPESLLESELFGHEKGAFTGAVGRRIGRFEYADGGTLLLDEIGDAPPAIQLKLLRVLQEKCIERLGSSETISVDVRVVAATNRDLVRAIADRQFREDLYYRLNVVTLRLPPLRERLEDIPELVRHFIRKHAEDAGRHIEDIAPECLDMLSRYRWPGNIRELENCIQRAVILCQGARILPQHIVIGEGLPTENPALRDDTDLTLSAVERNHIRRVLKECGGNQSRCAKILGIDRKTLRNKIRQYGLGTEIAEVEPENDAASDR